MKMSCCAENARYGGISKGYICPVCRKNFFVPFQTKGGGKTNWVYKIKQNRKNIYLCSYSCFNRAKKEADI